MANTVALTKILQLRELEKNDAQKAYHNSMEFFEKIATNLYEMLKKKEAAEQSYDVFIQNSTPLEKIKEQLTYIENLNQKIVQLQTEVQKARSDMELKQVKLSDAHTEVKKFEKIIKLRKQSALQMAQRQENQFMDEISVQQYLSHNNR